MISNCKNCGHLFFKTYKNVFFCSRPCSFFYRSKIVSGNKNPNWNGGKNKKCLFCKKLFWVLPSQINKKTCSLFCKGKIQSLYNVGIKAANWRGGNSFFPYPVGFNKKLKKEVWKTMSPITSWSGKR